jgi:hypothetical protein
MRPAFLPSGVFRTYLKASQLDKYARVDGIRASSYVLRCDRDGDPIRHKVHQGIKRWRLIDIVARAMACCLKVEPPLEMELLRSIGELKAERDALAADVSERKHLLALHTASARLTGSTLLTASEIAAGRLELPNVSGVYFLLDGEQVVYVGQSVAVHKRVMEHLASKKFDGFAYVACDRSGLDILESLYIHALRPKENGRWSSNGGGMMAPFRLDVLLDGADKLKGSAFARQQRNQKRVAT